MRPIGSIEAEPASFCYVTQSAKVFRDLALLLSLSDGMVFIVIIEFRRKAKHPSSNTKLIASSPAAMTDTELKTFSAEIISLNEFNCGRVLSIHAIGTTDVRQVSCLPDGVMDALVTFHMDARTGLLSGG